ncbi:MAG: hypothetical protein COB53_01605 [Elusimicrobia bacterium]|nr:MAG: hypothetical protein COB53_01605 [Elusimicrobiota bacterium]
MAEEISGLEFLKSFDIFANFTDEALKRLLSKVEILELDAGMPLFAEGETADSLYVVVSGEIKITRKIGEDMEKDVSLLGPKSICGEMSLFSGRTKRIAGARAKSYTRYYKIHIDLVREMFVGDPEGTSRTFKAMMLARYHQLAKSDRELATVYELSRLMGSDLNLKEFCHSALELICFSIPQAESGLIYLLDRRSGDYIRRGEVGYEQAPEILYFDPPAARVIGLSLGAARMDPIVVSDPLRTAGMLKGIAEAKAAIVMGIVVDEKLAGYCLLMNQSQVFFEKDCDMNLLRSFSVLLSSAIDNRSRVSGFGGH